ncbi:glycosyltransferase [Nannocystaceae bacterium ST9]
MISRYFPPMFDVGGKRAYRFARYLPEFGWRAVILTGRIPSERPVDATPSRLGPETRVERRYEPFWFREPGGRPSDGTIATPVRTALAQPNSKSSPSRRKLLVFPVGPDLVLAPHVIREATKLGRAERVDAVFATSSPYAVLVEGQRVAQRLGRPLCLDLRDPWTLNFFQHGRARWAAAMDRRIERRLFEQADRVILNCETTLAAYRELYPELPPERLTAIRNAFDPDERPSASPPPSGPIRLLHFGNCYGPRRLETMLRAMAMVRERRPDAPELVLENLGRVGTADLELAAELGLREQFRHGVFVPLAEGLARLAAADLAVLVAYGDETLYIPAKLYDYLLARSPIACIAPPGELSEIVERCGSGRAIRPGDVEGAAALIELAIDARARGERAFVPNEAELERYSARTSAKALAELLDAITG